MASGLPAFLASVAILLASFVPAGTARAATAAPAKTKTAAKTTLPDSVLVRMPHRDLTTSEVLATWSRLSPQYRPPGEGIERTRAFIDQLVEKEAMARAALAEPFVMTAPETARFIAFRQGLERQEVVRTFIGDSTVVTQADRDSARLAYAALADSSGSRPTDAAIEREARRRAEARRIAVVEARLRQELGLAYDDSVAALIARGYAAIGDTTRPSLDNPFRVVMKDRAPHIAAADTGRVFLTSTVGSITVGGFVERFGLLNPFQNTVPVTAGEVKARGEQFVGSMWVDAQAARRNFRALPSVQAALAERREGIALDHWYARHVTASIDTSEAALRAHYAKDPARYAATAHALIHHWLVPTRAIADSLVSVLGRGTPWDSLCAGLVKNNEGKTVASEADLLEACTRVTSIPADSPDTTVVAELARLTPGAAYVREEPGARGFRVVHLVERNELRVRPFEEVRTFVGRDLAAAQAEAVVTARMAELVKAMPKTFNEPAIARLRLEP